MDNLHIKGLQISTRIGVFAWEQQIDQRLLLDILIPADFSSCEDSLEKTVDYDKLCQKITQYVEENSFQLIETVANNVAMLVKKEFQLQQVTVSVSKPFAVKNASDVKVTVTR